MAVGTGWGFDRLWGLWPQRRWLAGLVVALALVFHAVDLGRFTSRFVQPAPREMAGLGSVEEIFDRDVRDGRVAVDRSLGLPLTDRFDDVGVFDSILLARPYRMLLALSGAPPEVNVQTLSGGRQLSTEALAASGVVMALTTARRRDLQPLGTAGGLALYRVPGPQPRVSFHPASAVRFETEDALVAAVRTPGGRRRPGLSLVPNARSAMPAVTGMDEGEATAVYRRPAGDRIEVDVTAPGPGFLEVLEAHDPGWSAEVDGRTAPIFLASGMVMAVPLAVAGAHHVVLRYETPGATAGRVTSLLSLGLLLGLLVVVHRAERPEAAAAATPAS
jgi:hypothetical protein